MDDTYAAMHQTYCNIFTRLGLDFRPVIADSGNIGGSTSHEFHVLADSGEDEIVFSSSGDYAANIEMAEGIPSAPATSADSRPTEIVETGSAGSIEDVASLLGVAASTLIKTLIVHGANSEGEKTDQLIALLLRGDQELNEVKAEKLSQLYSPITFADDDLIKATLNCPPGCIGPVDLPIPVIADKSVVELTNFVCGANQPGKHVSFANWGDSIKFDSVADIRKVKEGDGSPDGNGTLAIKRGIEVGHIFQLGTKYSESLKATVLNENGKAVALTMGCYGIGVTRVVAACIEQNNDERGIIWPENIAPFQLIITQIDAHKSAQVVELSEMLYQKAQSLGIEVLLDDRDKKTSPGVKFADSELIGIPHRLVVSSRTLGDGVIEHLDRRSGEKSMIDKDLSLDFLSKIFG
ncbi:MAG: prolyl-tRNA synthetase [Pseudohongiellaceae bacterium]